MGETCPDLLPDCRMTVPRQLATEEDNFLTFLVIRAHPERKYVHTRISNTAPMCNLGKDKSELNKPNNLLRTKLFFIRRVTV